MIFVSVFAEKSCISVLFVVRNAEELRVWFPSRERRSSKAKNFPEKKKESGFLI